MAGPRGRGARLAAVVPVLLAASCAVGPRAGLAPEEAAAFVQSVIAAGEALGHGPVAEADVLGLCAFAQSEHSCEQVGRTMDLGDPSGFDATIACELGLSADDVVVVVEASPVVADEEPVATALLVHRDRGTLALRHPFYWSGIGLVLDATGSSSDQALTVDSLVQPGAGGAVDWCPVPDRS